MRGRGRVFRLCSGSVLRIARIRENYKRVFVSCLISWRWLRLHMPLARTCYETVRRNTILCSDTHNIGHVCVVANALAAIITTAVRDPDTNRYKTFFPTFSENVARFSVRPQMGNDKKSYGLLFTAPMILAILEGRKTETRRVVTMHNSLIDGSGDGIRAHWPHLQWDRAWLDPGPSPAGNTGPYWKVPCSRPGYCEDVVHRVYPRIQPGDEIWARETWAPHPLCDHQEPPERVLFRADGANYGIDCRGPENLDSPDWRPKMWHSPLHLRRDTARIVRPCVGVGAERVQDISEIDAQSEGLSFDGLGWFVPSVPMTGAATAQEAFQQLWESINGAKPSRSWGSNPPVWVFRWTNPC